ncbi:biogenesis of lysosome-related organelles complex 1 subunit 5-like [Dreissena polymorpha]|uniref:biogenesis of lysosome-related organelles complex 1 subunit 5-like n=1 Tax=Dreissena polymorpha TaxID=45954 RepID=UPI002263E26A|nr:biogenesis of lysosome-related organelles complex 1 subunit 5-like [Dreissena polymorpha]XP_052232800.1 biogenesis of lysosome-related organelles complex 1 subunit 5-like [Dreissena polymorpha]
MNDQIIKDILEVHARLFDHRPILQGHLKAFIKEFEEKRGNHETECLKKIQSCVADVKDKYLVETATALDTFLANIQAKISVATEVCKKIEEKENNVDVGVLELERGRRREAWDTFMQQQFEKSALVDKEMDEGMKKLTGEYAEMEKKLELEYLSS